MNLFRKVPKVNHNEAKSKKMKKTKIRKKKANYLAKEAGISFAMF